MAGQMPVVVVPGGERQVDRHHHGPPAYGGDSPLPLGRRRFQYFFFWPLVFVAQFAGYIRPPPSLLPPSSPSPLPPLPLPLPLPLPPLPLPPSLAPLPTGLSLPWKEMKCCGGVASPFKKKASYDPCTSEKRAGSEWALLFEALPGGARGLGALRPSAVTPHNSLRDLRLL